MAGDVFEARWRPGGRDAAEAWWVSLADERERSSFWTFHGLRAPSEGVGQAELVAAWWDPEGVRAARVAQPLTSLALGRPFEYQLGRTRLGPGHARGEVTGPRDWFAWNLSWTSEAPGWTRRTGPLLSRGRSGLALGSATGATGTVTTSGAIRPVGAAALAMGRRWGEAPAEWVLVEAPGRQGWRLVAERARAGEPWKAEAVLQETAHQVDAFEATLPAHVRAAMTKPSPWSLEIDAREARWVRLAWVDASGERRWIHRTQDARVVGSLASEQVALEVGSSKAFPAAMELG